MNTGAVTSSRTDNTAPAPAPANTGAKESDVFLRLLVAQMRNQDPLQPTDPAQYMSQLAMFSNVERSVEMRDELRLLNQNLSAHLQQSTAA
jgi:flagellar basal-body rod modification protein FlgD